MKEAIGMVVGVVITLVSLVSFISNTFVPYRDQQAFMAQTNTTLLETLSIVTDESVGGTGSITLSGTSVKNAVLNPPSGVIIYINGSQYDGSQTIDETASYTKTIDGNNHYYQIKS